MSDYYLLYISLSRPLIFRGDKYLVFLSANPKSWLPFYSQYNDFIEVVFRLKNLTGS